jgi:hypothetical protein
MIVMASMGYLNFWQALTYRNARPKKTTVNSNIVKSCIAGLNLLSRKLRPGLFASHEAPDTVAN